MHNFLKLCNDTMSESEIASNVSAIGEYDHIIVYTRDGQYTITEFVNLSKSYSGIKAIKYILKNGTVGYLCKNF